MLRFLLLATIARAQAPDPFLASLEKQRAAAAIQRKSVQQQLEMAARYRRVADTAAPGPEANCPPIPEAEIAPILDGASRAQGLPAKLLRAVVEQESALRPCAVSAKGARGLMQLMPATVEQFGVTDPFDPKQNVEAGARFLKQLLEKYSGDLPLALGAYNAGPGKMPEAGGLPPFPETRSYVEAILRAAGMTAAATPRPPPVSQASGPGPRPE